MSSKWLEEREAAKAFYDAKPIPEKLSPVRTFTERQRIEQLVERAELSNWEKSFCASVLLWLTKKEGNYLSIKQRAVLEEMEMDYGLDPFDAGDSALPKHVPAPYAKSVARTSHSSSSFDDMDDDIPF